MTNVRALFTVDIGNTRSKFCFWKETTLASNTVLLNGETLAIPEFDSEFSDPSTDFKATGKWIETLNLGSEPCRWVVSSVNKEKTNALQQIVKTQRNEDTFDSISSSRVPIEIQYDNPNKLGMDRAVAAFSGLSILGKGIPFLVVDVGTAATIDYVDASGVFRGGAILPGPRLVAESLNANTAQLPLLHDPENSDLDPQNGSFSSTLSYPATETQSAIRLGVVFTLVGAIMSFYWKTRRRIKEEGGDPSRLALVLSGGNALLTEYSLSLLFEDLNANLTNDAPRPKIIVEPRLVVKGLFEIATGAKPTR